MNIAKGIKVLVTGGCGFIGFNLVEDLLSRGAVVSVLDLPESDWDRLPGQVVRIEADILNHRSFEGKLKDFDIIYHLAARTDLEGKAIEDYNVNYVGTLNLLKEVNIKKLKRFVFYSTILVNGIFDSDSYILESDPYRTNTFYGESKVLGETMVIDFCKNNGIDYTIIRPASIYGPWGESPYDEFFKTIKKGKYFHVGKATNSVSWCYVKNLTNFTIVASSSNRAINEVFYGSDMEPYTMRDIVDNVAMYYGVKIHTIPHSILFSAAHILGLLKNVGISVPIYPSRLKNIMATYRYSMKKSAILGYKQKYSLRQGIKETLEWYEKNRFA
jgi:nucleoside-diphosphate-sugar epimerase